MLPPSMVYILSVDSLTRVRLGGGTPRQLQLPRSRRGTKIPHSVEIDQRFGTDSGDSLDMAQTLDIVGIYA